LCYNYRPQEAGGDKGEQKQSSPETGWQAVSEHPASDSARHGGQALAPDSERQDRPGLWYRENALRVFCVFPFQNALHGLHRPEEEEGRGGREGERKARHRTRSEGRF
jgi:hypothetical protein